MSKKNLKYHEDPAFFFCIDVVGTNKEGQESMFPTLLNAENWDDLKDQFLKKRLKKCSPGKTKTECIRLELINLKEVRSSMANASFRTQERRKLIEFVLIPRYKALLKNALEIIDREAHQGLGPRSQELDWHPNIFSRKEAWKLFKEFMEEMTDHKLANLSFLYRSMYRDKLIRDNVGNSHFLSWLRTESIADLDQLKTLDRCRTNYRISLYNKLKSIYITGGSTE